MEENVNVNAELPVELAVDKAENLPNAVWEAPLQTLIAATDSGPCLYLGPAGQRCSRRAVEGQFCARHRPGGAQRLSPKQISQRSIAILGLLAVLWPVLADLIRELLRFLR